MRSFLICGAVLAMVAAPTLGAMTWDFEDGLQGWTITNTGTNTGSWVAPASTPLLYSDGMGTDIYGAAGGNVYLPGDSNGATTALFDLTPWLVGGSTQSYVLQADMYIANLHPLALGQWGYPGLIAQGAGITAYTNTTDWGTTILGRQDKGNVRFRDYASDDWTVHGLEWNMEEKVANPDWWNKWVTLKIDWNYSSPGNVIAEAYIPWDSWVATAGWQTLYSGPILEPHWAGYDYNRISLGAPLEGAYDLWSKAQFDNVSFDSPDLIPEPASLLLLSIGGVALLRRRR